MPTVTTYPGVYIEELPSSVRTITGVSTSITAFIGRALMGPVNKPVLIHSFAEFERNFGGLWKDSSMSYSVYLYFLNGGTDAIIIRVHNGAAETFYAKDQSPLKLKAANPGEWGNDLKIAVDHKVPDEKKKEDKDDSYFNLYVKDKNDNVLEPFLNLSTKADSSRVANKVLEAESSFVRIQGTLPNITSAADISKADGDYTGTGGTNGSGLIDDNVTGKEAEKTGIFALDGADIFNMLCVPGYDKDENTPWSVYTAARGYCEKRRAILIVDPRSDWKNKEGPKGITGTGFERHKNIAIYFPRIKIQDPKDDNRLRSVAPCGAVAGVIARTDGQRGIWKSPAGIEATLSGAADLDVRLTDAENGELNPIGINCLRVMGIAGRVVWGARTLRGADGLADQWKYLAVRRMALYIEESLYRGTQWVVFEPNDEPLWSQIRLNVGAFMHDLFRKGAFQGSTPKEAYLVKCDKETTTQYDIDRGIVNIIVGFAPLKPAEFVIIKIQQLAGQQEA
jgi:hypothetical protein